MKVVIMDNSGTVIKSICVEHEIGDLSHRSGAPLSILASEIAECLQFAEDEVKCTSDLCDDDDDDED